MNEAQKLTGGFTMPGESGYEELTLELAKRWGADVIRDSDGTQLSDDILNAGYGIYSTICIIRDQNEWAKKNQDKLQSCLLSTGSKIACGTDKLTIDLLEDYFDEQFQVNDSDEAIRYYQVIDRTTGEVLSRDKWRYDKSLKSVIIDDPVSFHSYTVNFFVFRIWEEISMYNHTTNNWDKEHLMQIDPVYEETREYMRSWLRKWCDDHPMTTVVRFTSLFYNFVWIWGSNLKNRHLYSDWGSYDFTVSPKMLDEFKKKYGYALEAEDFINGGKLHVTHMPPGKKQRDYMEFVNDFVVGFGKELVDIVHECGKKAYVFYDDSWIGIEPTGERFKEFGFDGLIKCVFSGFEVRLNSEVPVKTHEIRLHPYLFPVGLGGLPTFMDGGDPTRDARNYWKQVRRGMLRSRIDRIGLGGYLHLLEGYPDFVDYIEEISNDFRRIKNLHLEGEPEAADIKVAVLHSWGHLRSWTLSGHFHETYMHDLIHVNEALSGMPLNVSFISFEDVLNKGISEYDVILNAGIRGTAWSGGDIWKNAELIERINEWVFNGGTFIGINEPSAVCDDNEYRVFAMADVLGVDKDIVSRICHGRWSFDLSEDEAVLKGSDIPLNCKVHLTDGKARVLIGENGFPRLTINDFGKGRGIYLSGFATSPINDRMLFNLIMYGSAVDKKNIDLTADDPFIDMAFFPNSNTVVCVNNSDIRREATVNINGKKYDLGYIDAYKTVFHNIGGGQK
ncbi:MAG: 1,3-beta-galactosyl-N-acetylhexosamine phosphorylase [Lachnospiraceae bacterium]|nr:1,3-beta-galactosyl-N-acetylhexosamine phosphorylase [Lachnospiraceae bacterium]